MAQSSLENKEDVLLPLLTTANPQSSPEEKEEEIGEEKDEEDEDVLPPTTIFFESIDEELTAIETSSPTPPEAFKLIGQSFNSLPSESKNRILPYLLNWITVRDIKYFISVTRTDSEYTEREATIIDRFNLLPEVSRRTMFPKIASYFSLKDIDYQIIQDDKWLSPYIRRISR